MNESLEWCVVVWNSAPDKGTDWVTFGTALLAGLFALSGAWGSLYWQSRRENRSVRAALLAEIEALIDLCARHAYTRTLDEVVEGMRRFEFRVERGMAGGYYEVRFGFSQAYNQIYQANAQKIGVLTANEAKQVVRFYQLMDSVRTETSEGGSLYNGTTQIEAYEIAQRNFSQAMEIGKQLIGRPKHFIDGM